MNVDLSHVRSCADIHISERSARSASTPKRCPGAAGGGHRDGETTDLRALGAGQKHRKNKHEQHAWTEPQDATHARDDGSNDAARDPRRPPSGTQKKILCGRLAWLKTAIADANSVSKATREALTRALRCGVEQEFAAAPATHRTMFAPHAGETPELNNLRVLGRETASRLPIGYA
jgi:hypothetical protein